KGRGCRPQQTLSVSLQSLSRWTGGRRGRTGRLARRRAAGSTSVGVQSDLTRNGARSLRQAELAVLRQRAGNHHGLRFGPFPERGAEGGRPLPSGERELGKANDRSQHARRG